MFLQIPSPVTASHTVPDTGLHTAILQTQSSIPAPINLYQGHELKPVHQEPQPFNDPRPDWMFVVFVIVIAFIAWLRRNYHKYFGQIISAFFNSNLTTQIVRDENVLIQRATALLSVVFNLTASLFLYLVSVRYNWTMGGIGTGFIRYMLLLVIVSAVYAGKFVALKFFGWILGLERQMSTYMFNVFLINNVLGLFMLPAIAFLAFSGYAHTGWLFFICVSCGAFAYVYRIVRGFVMALAGTTYRPAYLFLYLCALEIAPLVVLVKVILLQ